MDYTNGTIYDYYSLMKPRVMSLVLFTSFVGLILSPLSIHPFMALTSLICIAVGAGSAGVLNMWYDSDIDQVMKRTINRPIPSGSINKNEALTFGLIMGAGSIFVMGVLINWYAAGFLAFTIFFYVVIYTIWLKRKTAQNIVIGGAAGAFPPVIGWLATDAPIAIEPLLLFLIIFLWTPPHFWALAILTSNEYEKVKVPMMPNVAGKRSTIKQILFYTVLTVLAVIIPYLMNMVSIVYIIPVGILSSIFLYIAFQLYRANSSELIKKYSRRMFLYSIMYLFLIFSIFLVDDLYVNLMKGLV